MATDAADQGKRTAWRDMYRNGFFLAPMVRIGTLPMRLLCLEYGADLVWTSEIVDKSIAGCERVVDAKTGVVAYIKDGRDIFTTHPSEKSRVIFQMGSAGPETALAAAKMIEQDVAGIDLNCGCPKQFSIQGGMGAALMSDPDRLCSILDALVKNINLPISCKIRVFDDVDKTLDLIKRIAATGVSALTVHCRTKNMRPREKAMWHRLNDVVKTLPDLPVILNGDVFKYEDAQRARDETGATSVMTARGAIENPSIFRPEGMLPPLDVAHVYIKTAVRMSNTFSNTKYSLMQMYPDTKSEQYIAVRSAKRYRDMCDAFGIVDFYDTEGAQLVDPRSDPQMASDKAKGGVRASSSKKGKRTAPETSTPAPSTADDTDAAATAVIEADTRGAKSECIDTLESLAKRVKT
ncbi:FMN-linked oxidoreductase [Martensiomyces pterosporus]|nr:FMN-linked oxidoreductase [Martensiomyces pterosporus]